MNTNRVKSAPTPPPPVNSVRIGPEKKGSKKKWILIAVAVLAILGGIAGGTFYIIQERNRAIRVDLIQQIRTNYEIAQRECNKYYTLDANNYSRLHSDKEWEGDVYSLTHAGDHLSLYDNTVLKSKLRKSEELRDYWTRQAEWMESQ